MPTPSATYTYEAGTDGATPGAGDNGTVAYQTAPKYASAAAIHGLMGMRSVTGTASNEVRAIPGTSAWAHSIYGVIRTQPTSGNNNAFLKIMTSANAVLMQLQTTVTSVNHFRLANSAGTALSTGTGATISANVGTPFRCDVQVTWDGTNLAVTANIYYGANVEAPSATTPDETLTASNAPGSTPARYAVGTSQSIWAIDWDTIREYSSAVWADPFAQQGVAAITATASVAAAGTTSTPGQNGAASITATASMAAAATQTEFPSATITAHGSLSATVATPGSVTYVMAGGARSDRVIFFAKTSGASSVKVGYSTSQSGGSLISPSFTTATAPDGNNENQFDVTGLTADTLYYWRVYDGGSAIGTVNTARTRPTVTGSGTVKIALGSCVLTATTKSTAAFTDLITWDPHYFLHLGDAYYNGNSANTLASQHRTLWETQVAAVTDWKSAMAAVAMEYINSDHELNPDDTDTNTTNASSFNAFFKASIPARLVDTASPPAGKYRSWVDSKIRFILLDIRNTDRSAGAGTDNSSKTMLGATQKAWLKNELIDSDGTTTYLKVIISDVPWSGTASLANGIDKWWAYSTERQEIADYITNNHVNVDFLHGDSHRLGVDRTHNSWGGFPVICGSAFSQTGGGAETNGFWDSFYPGTAIDISQYMRVTYSWSGNTLTRQADGYDAINATVRVSQTFDWAIDPGVEAITATATVGAAATLTRFPTAAVTAAASLSAAAVRVALPAAGVTATASLTAAAVVTENAAVAVAATAAITATPTVTEFPTAAITATASVAATVGGIQTGTAAIQATASLTVAGLATSVATATITATAAITAAGARSTFAAAAILATAQLQAAAFNILTGAATVTAHGSVAANGSLPGSTTPGYLSIVTVPASTLTLTGG